MTKERLDTCNELNHILSQLITVEIALYSETKCIFQDHLLVGIKDESIEKAVLKMRDSFLMEMQTNIKLMKKQLEIEFDKL